MKKKNKSLRKKIFVAGLSVSMLLSTAGLCFAKEYTYPNTGYTMVYTIGSATVGKKSGACATTTTVDDAVAFVSLFSYKNGNCKNSGSFQQPYYAYVDIQGNGGKNYKSVHALKDTGYDPMGITQSLTK